MLNRKLTSLLLILILLGISPARSWAASEPEVETRSVTDVEQEEATLRGRVDGNGANTFVWFEYGEDRDLNDSTGDKRVGSGNSNFSATITNLEPGTIYYYRAVAENEEGTDRGNIQSFRTIFSMSLFGNDYDFSDDPEAPLAQTQNATGIGSYTVQLNSLIINGDNGSSNAWFEWGTTPSLGYKTVTVTTGSQPQVRHADILSGLRANTTYYFRAVAENTYWRNNGGTLSFTTGSGFVSGGGGNSVAQGSGTNTIIIREPILVGYSEPVTENGGGVSDGSADDSNQSANVQSAGSILPGTLNGWLFLFLLILLIVWGVRTILAPKHLTKQSTM